MKKRIVSMLLCLVMVLSLMPTAIFAEGEKVVSVTIDGTTTEYATFAEANSAVSGAGEGAITVKLLADITETVSGYSHFGMATKTFTLDLNGHSLEVKQDGGIEKRISSGANITITDSVGGGEFKGSNQNNALVVDGGSLTVSGSKPFTLGYVHAKTGSLTAEEGTGAVFTKLDVENTLMTLEEERPTVTLNGGTYGTLTGTALDLMVDGKAFADKTTNAIVNAKEEYFDGSWGSKLELTDVTVVSHTTCNFTSGPANTGMCVCGRECDHGADKIYDDTTGLCECGRKVAIALVTGGDESPTYSKYHRDILAAFEDVADRPNGKLTLQYAQTTAANSVTIYTTPSTSGTCGDAAEPEKTDWSFPAGTYTVDLNGVTLNATCDMPGYPSAKLLVGAGANVTLTNGSATAMPHIDNLVVTGGSLTIPAAAEGAKPFTTTTYFKSGSLTVAEGANLGGSNRLIVWSSTGVSLAGGYYDSIRNPNGEYADEQRPDGYVDVEMDELLAPGNYRYYMNLASSIYEPTNMGYTTGKGATRLSNAQVVVPMVAQVTVDGTVTQYSSFSAALTAANAADGTSVELKLLEDCTEETTQKITRSMSLDLNGKKLTANVDIDQDEIEVTFTDSTAAGTSSLNDQGKISGTITVVKGTLYIQRGVYSIMDVGLTGNAVLSGGKFTYRIAHIDENDTRSVLSMLASGKGYRCYMTNSDTGGSTATGWVQNRYYTSIYATDSTINADFIVVESVPITGATITASKESMTYGCDAEDAIKLTVRAQGAADDAVISYQWLGARDAGSMYNNPLYIQHYWLNGATSSTYTVPVNQEARKWYYGCEVTVDGYTVYAPEQEITINKAQITSYPKGKTGLEYTGSRQQLIDPPTGLPAGVTVYYTTNPGDNSTWTTDHTYFTAFSGSRTIYWYIRGNLNYENVGSSSNPNHFTVTIAKATPSITVSMADWICGNTPSTPRVSGDVYESNKVGYQYKVKGADDSTYTSTVPTAVGEYTVKATVPEYDDLYEEGSATTDFKILAAAASVKVDDATTYYASFSAALMAAHEVEADKTVTLTLLEDCAEDAAQQITRSMTFELNGKRLWFKSNPFVCIYSSGVEVTIRDSSTAKTGKVEADVYVYSGAKASISGGTFGKLIVGEAYGGSAVARAASADGSAVLSGGTYEGVYNKNQNGEASAKRVRSRSLRFWLRATDIRSATEAGRRRKSHRSRGRARSSLRRSRACALRRTG